MNTKKLFEIKNLVINSVIINEAIKLKLDLNEFLILVYFVNSDNKVFDIASLRNIINIPENDALDAFNKLIQKKLINIVAEKDSNNKIVEKINIDGFYSFVDENLKEKGKAEKKEDIYSVFEKEFKRPLSSMEYEIINAWLEKSFTEDLIIGALKEAIYNGVTNLRYIDKILYEWQRKGFKNMEDVKKHLTSRKSKIEKESSELFDYNWLDDDNE